MAEKTKDAAHNVGEKVKDAAHTVAEKTKDAVHNVGDKIEERRPLSDLASNERGSHRTDIQPDGDSQGGIRA